MEYRELPPPAALSSAVQCIWTLQARAGELPAPEPVLPDGCIEMVFHLEGRFRADRGRGFRSQPAALVAGQLTRPLLLQPLSAVRTLGVRFRPGGARPLLQFPLHELTDGEAALVDVLGAAGAALSRAVLSAEDDGARMAAIESALLKASSRARPPRVAAAVEAIVRRRGALRVSDLRAFGLTGRHLLRRFRDEVGLGPKALCRVLRLQSALALRDRGGADWADVALQAGFCDQSHLVREARALAGAPPGALDDPGPLAAAFR